LAAQNELEQARFEELRQQAEVLIMSYDLDELFKIMEPIEGMPRGARILDSIVCEACGEATMESRTRRYAGRTICQPCFDKVEQKI
jgi:formylmethanofuran dehydrogenase subunit E